MPFVRHNQNDRNMTAATMNTNLYNVTFHVYSTIAGHHASTFYDLGAAMDHAKINAEMTEKSFRVVARYRHISDSKLNADIDIATFNGREIARFTCGTKIW